MTPEMPPGRSGPHLPGGVREAPPTPGGGLKRVEPFAYFSLLHLRTGLGGQVGLSFYLQRTS